MQSKSPSRLAILFLAILPSVALSACAGGPEVSAFAAADSSTCRSARQTAEIYRELQGSDVGIPYAMPAECEPAAGGTKRSETPRVAGTVTTETVMRKVLEGPFDHSPG